LLQCLPIRTGSYLKPYISDFTAEFLMKVYSILLLVGFVVRQRYAQYLIRNSYINNNYSD
jgi:hypothetical protein